MAKVINLKAQEEITSVVERLWETGEDEVYLVLPKSSTLLKNIIALKLLKREAERLGKEVVLVTKEPVGREMAKRVGLSFKAALPKKALEEESEEEPEQAVFKDVPAQKFENMLEHEVRARRQLPSSGKRFSDIRPKKALLEENQAAEEEGEEKTDRPLEEILAEMDVDKEKAGESFLEKLQKQYEKEDGEDATEEREEQETEEEPVLAEEEVEEVEDLAEEGMDEEIEDFPIHGLASGSRRIPVKKKKLFFSWLSSFGLEKIVSILRAERVVPEKAKKRLAMPFFSGKFLSSFVGAAAVVLLTTLYFILPNAQISLTPKTEAAEQSLVVVADKSVNKVDAAQNKIPGQLMKSDKRQSQEFVTTGQRQINDKAKGLLTIYNEYSSSPQALVEKTRFVSEGGQTFRLVKSITVPGAKIQEGKIVASSIEAEVVADQAGAEYNIGPGHFTIPGFQGTAKYAAFYGQSKSAMSGGASGLMKVVSQDDYDKAKEALWQNLRPVLDSEFKSQLPPGLKIVEGAIKEEISGTETSVAVGSPAEKFTVTLKGTAAAVLFDEQNVLDLIEKKLTDKIGEDKKLALEKGQINYQLSSVDYVRGQVTLKISATGKMIWKIKVDALKQELAGQNEAGIRKVISQHPEIAEARVVLWPFWVRSAPKNLDKVIIRVNE